jgi:hypothetical protein
MSARIGLGITQNVNKLSFGADIEYKQLLIGQLPSVTGKFETTDFKIKTLGAEEGKNALGIKVMGNYNITENIGIFAKADFFSSARYSNLGGNIGAAYKF